MTERLLLVDDDDFILSLNAAILAQAGYAVETAGDGQVAWEMVDAAPDHFDLILLDKKMPQLDGIACLKRLKADPRFKELPVVMLTGDTRHEDIAEGLAEGAFYYLTKPSEEAVLRLVVRNALDDLLQKRELRSQIGHHMIGLRSLCRAEFSCRTMREAMDLAVVVADASLDPQRTVTGYSELLINAVEHGNLGITYGEKSGLMQEDRLTDEIERRLQQPPYSDRRVNVLIERTRTAYTVTIADEGAGFDWGKYLEFSPERAFDLHGRGIAMSKAVCFDEIRYVGNGNTVIATIMI